MQLFDCFITQLVKKLQQLALYEMIEDILPIVLNTKRPLSDIWLPRYKQSSFGCFRKNSEFRFFSKTPKTVLLITHQQNIAQRPFCIQNEMQDILYHFIEGPLLQLFYELSNKAAKMLNFIDLKKTPYFGCTVRTLHYA